MTKILYMKNKKVTTKNSEVCPSSIHKRINIQTRRKKTHDILLSIEIFTNSN